MGHSRGSHSTLGKNYSPDQGYSATICQHANQTAPRVPSCFICQTHQEAHCFHRPIEIKSRGLYDILKRGWGNVLSFPHKCVLSLLLRQKRDTCKSDDFFIVEMEDMVGFTVIFNARGEHWSPTSFKKMKRNRSMICFVDCCQTTNAARVNW